MLILPYSASETLNIDGRSIIEHQLSQQDLWSKCLPILGPQLKGQRGDRNDCAKSTINLIALHFIESNGWGAYSETRSDNDACEFFGMCMHTVIPSTTNLPNLL
jgi:hypothetical protein